MAHDRYQTCIDACVACAEACNRCAVACLFEPNRDALARCVQLDMDCAEICRLAAGYLARNSELVMPMCAFCAEVCYACADECERHDTDHCRRCAEACRTCAEECRRMLVLGRMTAPAPGERPGAH